MAAETDISWADSTANFWTGCTKVSAACDNCYAEHLMDHRHHRVEWGPHGNRERIAAGWALAWMLQRAAVGAGGFDPVLGRRRRVFVNSLSDFFDNHRSIVWRDDAWQLIRECPNVIFMLLTKRPQNIAKMLPRDWGEGWDNVWIGTTVENQEEADRRIPTLLEIPAAVLFVSMEPLLGPVNLNHVKFVDRETQGGGREQGWESALNGIRFDFWVGDDEDPNVPGHPKLGWVICGGESGASARPTDPEWVRKIRDDCAAAGVPFHFKQNGDLVPQAWVESGYNGIDPTVNHAREVEAHGRTYFSIGVKNAGRLVDGGEHLAFPVPA